MGIFYLARHSSQREHFPVLRVKALGHPAHLYLKRNRGGGVDGRWGTGKRGGKGKLWLECKVKIVNKKFKGSKKKCAFKGTH